MSHLRRAHLRGRGASDHDLARRLAAERLSEPLRPDEATWLRAHLEGCEGCRSVAEDYEAQRLALHTLPEVEPPRDLWARTAAALDAEDARQGGRRRAPGWSRPLVPYGALAGLLVVAVVVASSLMAGGGSVGPLVTSPPASIAAAPTPVIVAAANVAWFAPESDGTYVLNVAAVDRVCPTAAQPDCAPLDGSGRQLLRLTNAPRAVLRSPQQTALVVLDGATRSVGGSVYVVPVASSSTNGASPGPAGTPLAIASAPATASPGESGGSPGPSAVVVPTPSPTTGAGRSVDATRTAEEGRPGSTPTFASVQPTGPAETGAPAQPSASSSGTAATPGTDATPGTAGSSPSLPAATSGPIAIISDAIVVGETAAYSPDGTWFAFSARPADGSHGPDIYVWHVGDLLARQLTSDHESIFSSWLGGIVLGSRVIPDALVPGDGAASGAGESSEPSSGTSPVASDGSVVPAPTAMPPSPSPAASTPSATDGSAGPGQVPGFEGASPSPSAFQLTGHPVSFGIDPLSGAGATMPVPAWRPVVDPSGRYAVYWSGTLGYDPASLTWEPVEGQLTIAPWPTLIGLDGSGASPSASASGSFAESPSPVASASNGTELSPAPTPSSIPAPSESGSEASPSASPEVSAAPPSFSWPIFGWSGFGPAASNAAESSPSPVASASSDEGPNATDEAPTATLVGPGTSPAPSGEVPSGSPAPSPTPFPPLTGPQALLPPPSPAAQQGAYQEWDLRWDPSGTHLAVWIGDPVDLQVGRLSLLSIDAPTGQVDLSGSLLVDAPALVGFSVADGRLAWATPSGQDGKGSRLEVLAWTSDGAGQLDSQPAGGTDTVVVVR